MQRSAPATTALGDREIPLSDLCLNPPSKKTNSSSFWLTARANHRQKNQAPPIQRVSRDGALPLSFNQERLWWLDRTQPDSSVHNLLHSLRLTGSLDVSALKQAMQAIVQRHELLRTSFPTLEGTPYQKIASDLKVPFSVIDLRHLTPSQQTIEVEQQAIAQANQPFDLEQPPLWRVKLLRLTDEEYIMLRTIHHIISDGWSHGVFMRELGLLYGAFSQNQPSPLLDLPVQYVDFAQSQRQWLKDEVLSTQLDYWKQQLAGTVAPLVLPTDRQTASFTYQGASQALELSTTLTEALKTFSQKQGVSLFVTLLAAFKTLLYQYTQQEDLVICSPVAGRHRPETKGLLGFFNNVVVMRTDLSGNPSFQTLLERVSQVSTQASEHQETPFQAVAALPNLLRTPLTKAMFALYNAPSPFSGFLPHTLDLANLTICSQFVNRDVANFDLSLLAQEKLGQLTILCQYKTDLWTENRIAQLLSHFQILLECVVLNPTLHLADLPVLVEPSFQSGYSNGQQTPQPEVVSHVADRNELEHQLTQIWETVFELTPIHIHDDFFALGGHSLLGLRLLAQVEQSLAKTLPLTALLQAPTIAQMAALLRQDQSSAPWSPLVTIQTGNSAKRPLFCIHGGGFNVLIYREVATKLRPDRSVYGLQARGLDGDKQAVPQSVEEMAADYIQQIQTIQPHGPYCLAGLSIGGTIALEMAQQLKRQGERVALLAMFDTYGPNGVYLLPPLPRFLSSLLYALLHSVPRFIAKLRLQTLTQSLRKVGRKIQGSERNNLQAEAETPAQGNTTWMTAKAVPASTESHSLKTHSLKNHNLKNWMNRFSQYVLEHSPWSFFKPSAQVQGIGGNMTEALKELEKMHTRVHSAYEIQPYDGQITLFRAGETPPGFYIEPTLGWRVVAPNNVEVYKIPGHHTSLMESPILAAQLQRCLDKWDKQYSSVQ